MKMLERVHLCLVASCVCRISCDNVNQLYFILFCTRDNLLRHRTTFDISVSTSYLIASSRSSVFILYLNMSYLYSLPGTNFARLGCGNHEQTRELVRVCHPQDESSSTPSSAQISGEAPAGITAGFAPSLKFLSALAASPDTNTANGDDAAAVGSSARGQADGTVDQAAAEKASAAASTSTSPRTSTSTSRPLRMAAEALASEIVIAGKLAEACSPRGVLRSLAICMSLEQGHHEVIDEARENDGGRLEAREESGVEAEGAAIVGKELREEREAALLAAGGRIRHISRRIDSCSRGGGVRNDFSKGGGDGGQDGAGMGKDGEDALSRGGDVQGSGNGREWGEGDDSRGVGGGGAAAGEDEGDPRAEAFRKELVVQARESGGLKELAVNWRRGALLDGLFVAWTDEV